ncbi:MAG: FkbM family methyltransferase [Actinomycetota bacterium]|nr:FkbM family methyltransferase [Actinomycetota bacterium]
MANRPMARANDFLRQHSRTRAIERSVTRPLRRIALPMLTGSGRGLRVRFGESALTRAVSNVEPHVEDAFLSLLHPGDVVYDIGANIGWYTLLGARAVGTEGTVVAFEPSVANAALVKENAARNGFVNVSVIPAAVTDGSGWATFLDKGSLEGRLMKDDTAAQARRRARRPQGYKGSSVVPVLALDSWLAETDQPPPKVIKIDVEGAEVGALRGMTATLRSARPALIIEPHGTGEELGEVLDDVDYEHEEISSQRPARPGGAHILARPRGVPVTHPRPPPGQALSTPVVDN